MQVESIAKKEVQQVEVLQEPLKDLQKNQMEIQNNQMEMQMNQQEIQKNQKEILYKLVMLEEARKSESMKRKQGPELFENEEEEEADEEALTKKKNKRWKPEKFPCEKCGKLVATHWKGRHDLGYCKSSVHGPPVPEGEARKVVVLPQTPYYTPEEDNFRSEDGQSSKSKAYSFSPDKYPEAILRSILAPKTSN